MNDPARSAREIFLDATDIIDPRQRATFLDRVCGRDAFLRQEVDELIQAQEAAENFLPARPNNAKGFAQLSAFVESTTASPNRLLLGPEDARIGPYKLLRKIGEGGCGVVYMAEQVAPLHREVAVKVIKMGMDTREVMARFGAERQALALMDHPNIARVFDAGATETGRPYFVMELALGAKITDYCKQESLSTRARLELFMQVCQAVQHAHQKGIIHRDLKPSNILISVNAGAPTPKIIDFGIAKAIQGRLTDQTLFTALEQFLGTPAYMSPEQAAMTSRDIDTRSDIYSLGVLLYELLTGTTPFDTKALLVSGIDELRRTIREAEPTRPSERLTQVLRSAEARAGQGDAEGVEAVLPKLRMRRRVQEVQGDLDSIVLKCLEKNRDRRYATASGLAADIKRYLNHETVIARPSSRMYQLHKTVRRHLLGFTAAMAVVTALSAGVLVSTLELARARRAERERIHLQQQAERDAGRARLAEADALAKVRDSYLAQAQAGRWSHRAGRRFTGLTLLKKAAEIRPGIDLRSEAIACLALTDLRTVAEWNAYPLNGLFGGFDANYSRYAYADKTGKIRVCRVGNETPLFEVGSPSSPLIDLCFSRRGALLHVTGSGESSRVQAFDVEGKTCLWQVDGPRYRTADSSADGKYLAISYEENSSNWPIRVVDASTGREAASFGHGSLPYFIRFNPMDSRQLLSSDAGTVVRLWDWTSGRIVHSFEHPSWVMGIDWDPAGNLVATACADNVLRFWDTTTGLEGTSLRGHEWTPTRVSISASRGRYLISHGWDGVLKLWDLAAKRALVDEPIFGTIFPFSRSDDRFACTTAWGKIAILEVVPGVGYTVLQRNGDPDRGITCDFSSDGRWLLSTHERSVCLWDLKTGEEVEAIQQHRGDMFATFVPGSVQFYLAGRNAVETWRINPNASRGSTRMALQQSFEGKSAISRPQRTPQGRTVTIGPDGFVTILNPLTGKEESRVSAIRAVEFAALSADGHFAATWNRFSESLDIYDLTTSKHVRELPAHASIVAEFSQDGRYLIVGDGVEYRAHTVGEWKSLYAIPRHSAGFWGYLAISSDSRMAALAISRNTVTLIETSTGVELAALEAPVPTGIHGLAFNGDGSQLASVNNEGAIQLWNLQMIRQELAAMNLDWETTSAAQIPRRAVAPP